MTTMMYPTLTKSQSMRSSSKRKSAVELLAESKPFYVKSELVRDTTQSIPTRPLSSITTGYGTYGRAKTVSISSHGSGGYARPTILPQYMAVSPSRSLPPISHRRPCHSTPTPAIPPSIPSTTDLLQSRLRQLLVVNPSVEPRNSDYDLSVEQLAPLSPPAEYQGSGQNHQRSRCHKSLPDLHRGGSGGEPSSNKSSNKSLSNRDSGGSSGHYTQRSEPPPPPPNHQDCTRRDSGSSTQHSTPSSYYCCPEAVSPCDCRLPRQSPVPPIYTGPPSAGSSFKRQKCLRYKQRDGRPILRSKSDISDRYWRPPSAGEQPVYGVAGLPTSHLEQFFEHLGMTSDSFEEMLSNSRSSDSPVFFSDVSTVDSSRPLDNMDYCPAPLRTSEPPSIVERNARIIKWLCNCRKAMLNVT